MEDGARGEPGSRGAARRDPEVQALSGRLLASAALAGALFGCATPGPLPALPELERIPASFEVQARISVRTPEGGDIARLRWTHGPEADAWIVSTPVGNEVARIDSGPRGARLTRADAEPVEAQSFAALAQELLGAPLEPAALSAWLHGSTPDERAGGWRVAIEERRSAGRVEVARRITATRGDVVVKMVIDDYRALDP